MNVAVLVPTLGRPDNMRRVHDDLYASVDPADVSLYFVVEERDVDSVEAGHDLGVAVLWNQRSASYAGAINSALLWTDEPYLFIGADDLHFHEGWLPPLLAMAGEFGFGLVGTNDLYNRDVLNGTHATHFLVTREYALTGCVDEPGVLLHEGYSHNWVDTEVVATAISRAEFAPCLTSIVEHLHPLAGKAGTDATYEKGRDSEPLDAQHFAERRHLWT